MNPLLAPAQYDRSSSRFFAYNPAADSATSDLGQSLGSRWHGCILASWGAFWLSLLWRLAFVHWLSLFLPHNHHWPYCFVWERSQKKKSRLRRIEVVRSGFQFYLYCQGSPVASSWRYVCQTLRKKRDKRRGRWKKRRVCVLIERMEEPKNYNMNDWMNRKEERKKQNPFTQSHSGWNAACRHMPHAKFRLPLKSL